MAKKVYTISELSFLKETLGLDNTASHEEFLIQCYSYTGESRSYRKDIITLYVQSMYNDMNDDRTQLVEDGVFGRLTRQALEELEELANPSAYDTPITALGIDEIQDIITKLLPLWHEAAHEKVIIHFYEFLKIAGSDLRALHLVTEEDWALFASQLREETGPKFKTVENLNYGCDSLLRFGRFRRNKAWARKYGRCDGHRANQDMIANIAYSKRRTLGNGDLKSGDGLRFKGGGGIQTTGRYNYRKYMEWLRKNYPALYERSNGDQIMVQGYKVLSQPGHSILSAAYYYNVKKLYKALELATLRERSDYATDKVNRKTHSYDARYANLLLSTRLLAA